MQKGTFAFAGGKQDTGLPSLQDVLDLESLVAQGKPATTALATNSQGWSSVKPLPLRQIHCLWKSDQAKQERQGALSRWSALLRLAPALFGE